MPSQNLIRIAEEAFAKTLEYLIQNFSGLQVGRASAALVETLQVDIYGATQPLKAVASVSVPDAKTLAIQPWDKANLVAIEKAIRDSQLNLNPNNDGLRIILNIPPLTEERRRELTKLVGSSSEEARISIRRHRQDIIGKAKREVEATELTEDEEKVLEKRLQEKVDEVNKKIDELAKEKEVDIMKI